MDFAELNIDPKYHRNIIGKGGQSINKLRDQYKVIAGKICRLNSGTFNPHNVLQLVFCQDLKLRLQMRRKFPSHLFSCRLTFTYHLIPKGVL